MTRTTEIPKTPREPGRRRKRLRQTGVWLLAGFAALLVVLVVGLWAMLGRPWSAPEWLRTEIEQRIAEQLPGYDLNFSDMTLYVRRDLRPDITLSNVEVREAGTGRLLVELSRVEAAIAAKTLLAGKFLVQDVLVSGVFLRLRRERDGSFDIAFGNGLGNSGIGLSGLVGSVDDTVSHPRLAALSQVDVNAVTLEYQDARSGRAWTVDGGRLNLTRIGTQLQLRGDFAVLSGREYVATLELGAESTIGSSAVSLGLSVDDVASGDIATQSAALAWLGVLRAPISGALRTSFDDSGTLGALNATLRIGEGVLQPIDATRPIPFTSARTYFTFDPASRKLRFDEIAIESDWVSAGGSGQALLEGLDRGLPEALLGQVTLTDISANPNEIFDAPRSLASANLDFHLALDPFLLRIGQLTLNDSGGPVHARGRIRADPDGWDISMMGHATDLLPSRLLSYWPDSIKPKTRAWVATNVLGGSLRNASVRMAMTPDRRADLFASAEIADASVRFMRNMPPVTGAAGLLQFEGNRLDVTVDRGSVTAEQGGALEVAGTVFSIPDVRIKPGPASVRLAAAGPIHAALWLLDRKPLQALTKVGREVDLATGQLQATGTIDFILKPKLAPNEVRFAVRGTAEDVASEVLVPGKTLAARQLSFAADNGQLRIEGPGALDAVPFDGFWQTPLGPGAAEAGAKVEADITLSQATLDAFNIRLPPGSVSGSGLGRLTLDLKRGEVPEFSLTSALAGLALRLDAIGWSKARDTPGSFVISGGLSKPPRIDRLQLLAPGMSMDGKLTLRSDGSFASLQIDRLRAGAWLDAPVTLTGRGRDAPPAVLVAGGRIDMRNAPFSDKGGENGGGGGATSGSGPLTLAPDRLQISDGIALTDFRGEFSASGGLKGRFQARLNGGTPLRGTVTPTNTGSRFRIQSDEAGGVLRDAGLLKNVHGGTLALQLQPTGATGTFDGQLDIRNTRIRNAPVMAALLNAISVIGLLEQLGGQGISFGEVEARFRLTPKQVILTRSSAVGPSMGISLDGYYDLGSKTMDMQGVVSPIYVVNFVGQLFTRKGEGLFGFNFNLKGRADNPQIAVNPLSALTPGMFREIFRRPPPRVQQ